MPNTTNFDVLGQDSMMDSLSSFPEMPFDIFDRLMGPNNNIDDNQEDTLEDSLSSFFSTSFGIRDSLTLSKGKLAKTNQDEVEDDCDSHHEEVPVQICTLQRGARRGGTVKVLTKLHDGPSPVAFVAAVKTATDATVTSANTTSKTRSSPAA